jgi:predicted transcriptional regulator
MHAPPQPQPRRRRYTARHQARLDAETHAKLAELSSGFHRKRAAILHYVMQWGLAHTEGWTIDLSIPDRPHLVHMLVQPELLQQVQDAADAHGVSMATWLRHAMHQVTPEDFPPSWRAGETTPRSHDSGYYGTRFMLRLDEVTSRKLTTLTQTFDRSAAEIIRQLITRATPEDFPPSWQTTAHEGRARKGQPSHDGLAGRVTLEGGL